MTASQERLDGLAEAFGSSATLGDVADALIARSRQHSPGPLTYGQNERGAVMGVLSVIVDQEGAYQAIAGRASLSQADLEEMSRQILANPPETIRPPEVLVELILNHLRAVYAERA
jgi:hypothetical protein